MKHARLIAFLLLHLFGLAQVRAAILPPAFATGAFVQEEKIEIGQAASFQILVSGEAPASYTAAGLPAGLTLNTTTGVISGTPTQGGKFTLQVTATNSGGTGAGSLNVLVLLGGIQTVDLIPGVDTYEPQHVAVNTTTGKVYATGFPSNQIDGGARNGLAVIDAATGTTIAGIDMDGYPLTLAVNGSTNRVYALVAYAEPVTGRYLGGGILRVIDGQTNTVIASVPLTGGTPSGIAVNAATNKVYVSYPLAPVNVIDGATHTVTTGPNVRGYGIAVDPATGKIYILNEIQFEYGVSVYDGTSYAEITRLASVGGLLGGRATPMAVDSVAGRIYVPNGNGLGVISAGANTATTIATDFFSIRGVAVDAATHRVFVSGDAYSQVSSQIAVINGETQQTVGTLTGAFERAAFNPVDGKLYAGVFTSGRDINSITAMDPSTGAIRSITTGRRPSAIASNPTTRRIYIADATASDLLVLDGATRAIIARIPIGFAPSLGTGSSRDVVVNPATNRIYTTGAEDNYDGTITPFIRVIDGDTNTIIASIPAKGDGVAVNPVTNKIYFASGGTVLVLDGASNTLSSIALTATYLTAYFIAVDPTINRIYATHTFDPAGNNFTAINGATNAIVATASVGADLEDIAVNTTTGRIYIANDGPNYVRVLQRQVSGSTETFSILATVNLDSPNHPYGDGVHGIAVNSATNRIYVTNNGNDSRVVGSFYEINGSTNAVTGTYDVGYLPLGVGVETGSQDVYVANAADGTISVLPAQLSPMPPATQFSVTPPPSLNTGLPWSFSATQAFTVTGLTVRVQSTLTPGDEGSWTNLPGGGQMTRAGDVWTLVSSDIPVGLRSFRSVSAALGFTAGVLARASAINVGGGAVPFVARFSQPVDGTVFPTDATIAMTLATTPEAAISTIVSLQYSVDGQPFGSLLTAAPFSLGNLDLAPGDHVLTARFTDDAGRVGSPTPSRVTIASDGLPGAGTDTIDPTVRITAAYTEPLGGKNVKFTFYVEASDDQGLAVPEGGLEFREHFAGRPFGPWNRLAYDPEQPLELSLQCTFFEIQFRAVDRAGNRSVAVTRSFSFPFPKNPPPSRDPSFNPASPFISVATSTLEGVVADADFDDNGRNDLVHALGSGFVSIRRNTGGAANFATEATFTVPAFVASVAAGRVSAKSGAGANDSLTDLVFAAGGAVRVFINQWDSATQSLTFIEQGTGLSVPDMVITEVAVGDMNGDGFDDVVASGNGTDPGLGAVGKLAIFFNNGSGTILVPTTTYIVGGTAGDLALGDIDGDGELDVAVADTPNFKVSLLRNTGQQSTVTTAHKPFAVAIGDFTRDGRADLAAYGRSFGGGVTEFAVDLLEGNGDATFQPIPTPFVVFSANGSSEIEIEGDVAIRDMNGDGNAEIIVPHLAASSVLVARFTPIRDDANNIVRLRFESAGRFPTPTQPIRIALGDINGDGRSDILVGQNFNNPRLNVLFNTFGRVVNALGLAVTVSPRNDPAGDDDGRGGIRYDTFASDVIDCTFTYSNNGPATVPAASIVSVLPAGTEFLDGDPGVEAITVGGKRAVRCTLGDLASGAGDWKTFRIAITAAAKLGKTKADAILKSGKTNFTARWPVMNILSRFKLEPQIAPASNPNGFVDDNGIRTFTTHPGDVIEYQLFYKNRTDAPLTDFVLFGEVPPGTEAKLIGGALDADAGANPIFVKGRITGVIWEFGTLAAQEQGFKRFRVVVGDSAKLGQSIEGDTRVRAEGVDEIKVLPPRALIESTLEIVAEQEGGTSTARGGAITYKLTVTNRASGTVNNVIVSQRIPQGTYTTLDANPAPSDKPFTVTSDRQFAIFNVGDIAAGARVTLRIRVRVQFDFRGTAIDTHPSVKDQGYIAVGTFIKADGKIAFVKDIVGPNLSIPIAEGEAVVRPIMGLSKRAIGDRALNAPGVTGNGRTRDPSGVGDITNMVEGGAMDYELIITNSGTASALDVVIHDVIPKGVKLLGSFRLDDQPMNTDALLTFYNAKNAAFIVTNETIHKTESFDVRIGTLSPGQTNVIRYTVAATVKAGTEIRSLGGLDAKKTLSNDAQGFYFRTPSLSEIPPGTPDILFAQVIRDAYPALEYKREISEAGAGSIIPFKFDYTQNGDVTATNARIHVTIPLGTELIEATDATASALAPRYIGQAGGPAVQRSGNKVEFILGDLLAQSVGAMRFHLRVLSPLAPGLAASRVAVLEQPGITYARLSNTPGAPAARLFAASAPAPIRFDNLSASLDPVPIVLPTEPHLLVGRSSVWTAVKGRALTYTIFFANWGDTGAQNVQIAMQIPARTKFLSATNGTIITPASGSPIGNPVAPDTTKQRTRQQAAAWGAGPDTVVWNLGNLLAGHSAGAVTLTVEINANFDVCAITDNSCDIKASNAKGRGAGVLTTNVRSPNGFTSAWENIGCFLHGIGGVITTGNHDALEAAVRAFGSHSINVSIGGADGVPLTNGTVLIPIHGDRVLVIGSTLIANDGGTMVASGGGNLNANNLIANDGGTLVASGGGNVISITKVRGFGTTDCKSLLAQIEQLIANDGGTLVASGGGNLIGLDGASLIANDGGTLRPISPSLARMVASGGGNLIANDGGSIISTGFDLSDPNAKLIGNDVGTIVAGGGGNLSTWSGGNLIGNDVGTFVP